MHRERSRVSEAVHGATSVLSPLVRMKQEDQEFSLDYVRSLCVGGVWQNEALVCINKALSTVNRRIDCNKTRN